MKWDAIKQTAKQRGINVQRKNKIQLIKEIQKIEGNFDCFKTPTDYCDQWNCAWRVDCLDLK